MNLAADPRVMVFDRNPDPGSADGSQAEVAAVQEELREIRLLIRQMEGEVERMSQRSSLAIEKVREAEANLLAVPPAQLTSLYTTACDAQLRLLTMQAQRDLLQSKEQLLERCLEYLGRVQGPASSGSSPGAGARTGDYNSIARIIQAQEDERHRLARQIHDGPAQSLTNVVLRAEICQRLLDIDTGRARAELDGLKELVRATLQETRRFIFDVRPMILDDLGLLPTLRRYIQAFNERGSLQVDLTVLNQQREWPTYAEVAIFRVIQEALENAARHAAASRVQVKLDMQETVLEATIEDDGRGLDVEAVLSAARERQTMGIASMLERMEVLGGKLVLESAPGRGTRVRAQVMDSPSLPSRPG